MSPQTGVDPLGSVRLCLALQGLSDPEHAGSPETKPHTGFRDTFHHAYCKKAQT